MREHRAEIASSGTVPGRVVSPPGNTGGDAGFAALKSGGIMH